MNIKVSINWFMVRKWFDMYLWVTGLLFLSILFLRASVESMVICPNCGHETFKIEISDYGVCPYCKEGGVAQ